MGLAKPVADVPVELKRLPVVLCRLPILTQQPDGVPQAAEGMGLAKPVASILGNSAHGGVEAGGLFVPAV